MSLLLLQAGLAWARAGGGHGFSGGGGSGGSFGGGGGYSGGGGDGDGAGLLIWLVLQHPVIGIPVMILVIGFVLYSKAHQGGGRQVYRTHHEAPRAPVRTDTGAVLARDPNFSEPLFLDLARLVYTRAHEERGRGNWGALEPFVSPNARQALQKRAARDVRDVIVGTARILDARVSGDVASITVHFESNLTEGGRAFYVRERWTFQRSADTLSPGPDKMRALNCPNCGSPIETLRDGRCASCESVLTDARLQWQLVSPQLVDQSLAPALDLHLGAGIEPGTGNPTLTDPDLGARQRALTARHPDFSWADFRARATEIFQRIQEAWSDASWEKARPFETDFLFQQHRYWMERYAKEGLKNRLADVTVTDVVLAKITVDAYLEAVTVRIYARMRDWTEDADGRVVGGSRDHQRVFTEYWTFLRSAGKSAQPREHLDACPSCGAPLDKVSESGVCGYCEAKITGGEFDWVLAGIDQDDVYRG